MKKRECLLSYKEPVAKPIIWRNKYKSAEIKQSSGAHKKKFTKNTFEMFRNLNLNMHRRLFYSKKLQSQCKKF